MRPVVDIRRRAVFHVKVNIRRSPDTRCAWESLYRPSGMLAVDDAVLGDSTVPCGTDLGDISHLPPLKRRAALNRSLWDALVEEQFTIASDRCLIAPWTRGS